MQSMCVLATAALLGTLVFVGQSAADPAADDGVQPHRTYCRLLDPREHPDYGRRAVKPPTWDTFGNRTQFMTLRGFPMDEKSGLLVKYAEELEKYTRTYELGEVIWPYHSMLKAKNLGDLVDEIKRRNLYLFDIWGYVPGSGLKGGWVQIRPSPGIFAMLESKLGERWLGMDNGEQDGRYVGGYAGEMTPNSASRLEQYFNFQRHFERLGDDLGNKLSTLVSLNFGHYFLKEGTYTLIGAETAQALPNSQVYYAFIRGAGKQYGVPWFGNASVWNRWGWKNYGSSGNDFGPMKGTSVSLLKRLLYSHILYNSMAVGFESGWFDGDKLSPVGTVQQSAQRWVKEHGQPGVMQTPVAILLDFHSGWSFPRHLYTGNVYRVWGNLPYEPGDYLTDAVIDMLYPGYQNSSYYHDETGFLSPTPYGDIADCLLSDAPLWLLARYPVVVVAGELAGGREIRDKLCAYVENGGHLAITQGNLAKLPSGLPGAGAVSSTTACGKGRVTVFAGDFGVDLKKDLDPASLASHDDEPLPKPYELRPEARKALDGIFRSQQFFATEGGELSLITCRKGAGEYTVSVTNNTWREQPLKIVSLCGPIESLQELKLDVSEREGAGYVPEGVDAQMLGQNTDSTIAGGDVRIFAVRVKESGVEEIAHVVPAARPHNRFLPLRRPVSIKEEILARPTFFEHFDGVVVDWRYLHERDEAVLKQEAGWIQRQGLRVVVDLRSGLNLFPTLRLVNNDPSEYQASMDVIGDVLKKMSLLKARDLIMRRHRVPENNVAPDEAGLSMEATVRSLAEQAARLQIVVHLQMQDIEAAKHMVAATHAGNFRIAINPFLLDPKGPSPEASAFLKEQVGLWLMAGQRRDVAGQRWDTHAPVHLTGAASATPWIATAPDAPLALDAVFANTDDEYLDAATLKP